MFDNSLRDSEPELRELYERARRARNSGHNELAGRLFDSVAKQIIDKRNGVPFILLAADAYLSAGDCDSAIENCIEAVGINPTSSKAYRSLGLAYLTCRMNVDAEEALQKSLELSPSCSAHLYLSSLYLAIGKAIEAEDQAHAAIRLDVELDEAYLNLGLALRMQERFEESKDAFVKALSLTPDYVLAHRELGVTYLAQDNVNDAARHLRRAIEIDPNDCRSRDLLREITK